MSVTGRSAIGFPVPNGQGLNLVLVLLQGNMYMGARKNTGKLSMGET